MEERVKNRLKHNWTEEERQKVNEFLLAAKKATLAEMKIEEEDVLFWSIHWDESMPHIHIMVLPTVILEYTEDVYGKHVYKDGTRKRLHLKGDIEKRYSVERFYAKDENGRTPFFDNIHQNVITRMEELGYDASGLLNGNTLDRSFQVSNKNRSVREMENEQMAELLALRKKIKVVEEKLAKKETDFSKMEAEFRKYQRALQNQLNELQAERDSLSVEREELEIELLEKRQTISKLSKTIEELKTEI